MIKKSSKNMFKLAYSESGVSRQDITGDMKMV